MNERMSESRGRELTRNRAGGRCEVCGHAGALEHAHRKSRAQGGGWEPSNTLRLCRVCHAHSHHRPDWSMEHGLMVPRGGDPATVPVHVLVWGQMPSRVLLDDEGQYEILDILRKDDPTWPYQSPSR